MLQRVGLAQAIVNDPELLILDEPTSALDPRARVIVRELLLDFRNRGKTIFLSSHLLSEVEVVCDRVAVLNRGNWCAWERPAAFSNQPTSPKSLPVELLRSCWWATATNGLVSVKVPTEGLRAALERVWQAGGEVVSVNPVRKSLETLFLELTTADDQRNTGPSA